MSETSTVIKPSIGVWKAWAMVVGTMIGSGVFMVPSLLAPYGTIALWAWVGAGIGAIIMALALGNVARRMPKVGGCYAYTRAGFGDFAGFLIAWGYWISVWSAMAAIAVAFVGYLGFLFPTISASPSFSILAGLIAIWVLVGVNLKGIREMATLQLITSLLKLSPLVFIGVYGLVSVTPATFDAYTPLNGPFITLFSTAIAITMFSFMGLDAITVPAEDVINPKRTIPKALILGTATAALVYFISTYAVMGILPQNELIVSTAPFADAAMTLIGPLGGGLIAVGALVSCFGALNSNLCCAGQIPMAAARDKLFPSPFARMNKNGVPDIAIIVAGVLASLLLVSNFTKGLLGAYQFILLISTIMTLISYAFATAAGLMIKDRDEALSPKGHLKENVIAILAFAVAMFAMAGSGFETVYWSFFLLMAGIPVYVWIKHKE